MSLIELEIHATYLGHWKAYKRPGSFNSQLTLTVHHLHPDLRLNLLCFIKTRKAPSFFLIFLKIFAVVIAQKVKIVAFSSSAASAEPQMGGVPLQEAPISGKKSSNGFRH